MATERDHDGPTHGATGLDNRLWRVEKLLGDADDDIKKCDAKIEGVIQRQDDRRRRVEDLENRLAALEKKPAPISSTVLGESQLVRGFITLIIALMGIIIAMITGQSVNFMELFQ